MATPIETGLLFVLTINGQRYPGVAATLTEALGVHRENAHERGRERRQPIAAEDRMTFRAKPLAWQKPRRRIYNLRLNVIHPLPNGSDRGIFE
jgi:hypothetical protein